MGGGKLYLRSSYHLSHYLGGGGRGSHFLLLSLFSLSLSLYSLYPFSFDFFMVSLSLVLIIFYLSPLPMFCPRDGVWTRGDRVMWKKKGGGENS